MILTQTKAIFLDAYREINAKKLFWITMALTVLFALIIATLGIDEEGVKFLSFHISFIPINTDIVNAKAFYLSIFSYLGIGIWLSWIATIIAIISTSGIIPDLATTGVIECMLSRPLSRVRLFLTKYATGLMFVALQVGAFAVLSMIVIWVRSGYFEPRILLAIPIVVSFFSFLYCVCALVGLITKSTMTSMMLTGLFWAMLFLVNLGESIVIQFDESTKLYVEQRQAQVELARKNTIKDIMENSDDANRDAPTDEELYEQNPFLSTLEQNLQDDLDDQLVLGLWSNALFTVKTVLPKTSETIELLNRQLIDPDAFNPPEDDAAEAVVLDPNSDINIDQGQVADRVRDRYNSRSVWWVLGTSYIFQGVILSFCCLIFSRRDF